MQRYHGYPDPPGGFLLERPHSIPQKNNIYTHYQKFPVNYCYKHPILTAIFSQHIPHLVCVNKQLVITLGVVSSHGAIIDLL